jgi:lactoylglutathione lyase
MVSWLGQYCINVSDLEASVARYEAMGLRCDSRTEIDQAWEAVIAYNGHGSRMQLAQQKADDFRQGNDFRSLVVCTRDARGAFAAAVAAGCSPVSAPVTIGAGVSAVVADPDGYVIELIQDEWTDSDPTDAAWLGAYTITVADLDRTVAFYTLLGLALLAHSDDADGRSAVLANPEKGSTIRLVQPNDLDQLDNASLWKLYVWTDDCIALHAKAVAAGSPSLMEPAVLDRWPVTVGFVADPDGYRIELISFVA